MSSIMSSISSIQRKSYLISIIIYSMIWCIVTMTPNGHLLIKEEKFLRKLVNFIHLSSNNNNNLNLCIMNSQKLYTTYNTTYYNDVSSSAASSGASSSTSLSTIIDLNETFYPIFHHLITQKSLTQNFLHDIYRSIQIMREFNYWLDDYQGRNESTKQFDVYLMNLLQLSQPIHIYNTDLFNNLQSNYTKSNLIGIGYCLNGVLMAYVNNYTTTSSTTSSTGSSTSSSTAGRTINAASFDRNSICNQFLFNVQSFHNHNDTIHFNDLKYGKFSSFWAPIQCESNSIIPIVLRYFIYTTERSLFFEFDLKDYTIDQCALNINRCGATTRCVYKKYNPYAFSMDNYMCECSPGYYTDNIENGYPAPLIESKLQTALMNDESELPRFYCRSCPIGCFNCKSNTLCRLQLDYNLLRAIPLAFQTFCITICLLFGIAMFKLRRARVIKSANLVLMEIMLVGAILLYSTIVVMYFPVSDISCLILPWFREVGFSVMYGVLIVKIYRVLSGFQSRKAHRVHVRDKDILKYLGMFILITFTYMIAWTAINLDYINNSPWIQDDNSMMNNHQSVVPIVSMKQEGYIKIKKISNQSNLEHFNTKDNNETIHLHENQFSKDSIDEMITFEVCRAMSWDVVVELAEFIILAISIHYCRLVRTAPSEYNETQYIGVALIIEMTVSGFLYLLRHFIWYNVHPDYIFLLYFVRSHITVTVNLLLIFVPKVTFLCRSSKSLYNTARQRGSPGVVYPGDPHLPSGGKLNLVSNGDLDIADVNLADMDPEVIRRELKRLYTQIELYKTKAMRKDNPHISKRRGGRKQRRFSLQPFHKRHHGQTSSSISGNVIPTDTGCCCTECQSSKFTVRLCPHYCSRHISSSSSTSHKLSTNDGSGNGSNRGNYSTILHDEEISKLSEESTNSGVDDQLSVNNLVPIQQQSQNKLCSSMNSDDKQIKPLSTGNRSDSKRSKCKSTDDKTR
ncbi:unnamed protein product [Schistosoma rodhaini]|uniref:G-protein coupled receptors family 3 profile domain-containing protein n=1 Tax=Schistosoma rodhaini TaxID=6188 RepID=A0AA85ESZ7_9TREM|nr:unnamed protein product [Schistosoma rodhaini]